jgi:hypothetical protein
MGAENSSFMGAESSSFQGTVNSSLMGTTQSSFSGTVNSSILEPEGRSMSHGCSMSTIRKSSSQLSRIVTSCFSSIYKFDAIVYLALESYRRWNLLERTYSLF